MRGCRSRPAALLRGEIAVEQVGRAAGRAPPPAPGSAARAERRSACRSCPSCRPACPASPSTGCSSMRSSWARRSWARPRPSRSTATPAPGADGERRGRAPRPAPDRPADRRARPDRRPRSAGADAEHRSPGQRDRRAAGRRHRPPRGRGVAAVAQGRRPPVRLAGQARRGRRAAGQARPRGRPRLCRAQAGLRHRCARCGARRPAARSSPRSSARHAELSVRAGETAPRRYAVEALRAADGQRRCRATAAPISLPIRSRAPASGRCPTSRSSPHLPRRRSPGRPTLKLTASGRGDAAGTRAWRRRHGPAGGEPGHRAA